MPPKAAPNGSIAFFNDDSSPFNSSRFISVAANTKKKAIKKLFIHSMKEPGRYNFVPAGKGLFQMSRYHEPVEELDITIEIIVQPISNTPVARLSLKKSLKGVIIL